MSNVLRNKNKFLSFFLIIFLLSLLAIFDFLFRLQTLNEVDSGIIPWVIGGDAWYNIHLIEQMIPNFPAYPWFDPMHGFPVGRDNNWGPLFPLIAAFVCILFHADSTFEIIRIASFIPPMLSIFAIPLVYIIGEKVWDKNAGICSAIMITFISGEYQFRSMYGYTDHHILETIISTLYIAIYILIIKEISHNNLTDLKLSLKILFLACLSAFVYYLGIMNIPTMLLFALIISLFTIFSVILADGNFVQKLCIVNIISFGLFTLLFIFTGIHHSGYNLRDYSVGHVFIGIFLILGNTGLLYISKWKDEKKVSRIIIFLVVFFLISIGAVLNIIPVMRILIFNSAYDFFMASSILSNINIEELGSLDPGIMIYIYNIALPLMIIGFIALCLEFYNKRSAIILFSIIWNFVIIILSLNQARYQYYWAICLTVLCGVALSCIYHRICRKKRDLKPKLSQNKSFSNEKLCLSGYFSIGIILVIFVCFSIAPAYTFLSKDIHLKEPYIEDWKESFLWLSESTPDIGINSQSIYLKEGFSYPETAYTVASGVNEGLKIISIGKRIPTFSIFAGTKLSGIFTSKYSSKLDNQMNKEKIKYIITDRDQFNEIISIKNMPNTNYNNSLVIPLFYKGAQIKDWYDLKGYGFRDPFYQSLFARLYFFDGSLIRSEEKKSIEYIERNVSGTHYAILSENTGIGEGEVINTPHKFNEIRSEIVSYNATHSTIDLPALTTFRLVYESPTVIPNTNADEIHIIKIYEHIKGYIAFGNGTIELPVVTNQGRHFIYQQKSVNGTFTLPYATINSPYGVHATGPYRIVETNDIIDVNESDIQKY